MQKGFPIAMQRAASQNNLKLRPLPNARRVQPVTAGPSYADTSVQNSLLWLLAAGALTYGLVAIAMFGWIVLGGSEFKTTGSVLSNLRSSLLGSITTKESFLNRVNLAHKRELFSQINYLAGIITKVSSLDKEESRRLAQTIVLESRTQNLDPLFVAAVIKTESTFKRGAVSNRGALGLMQLMPETGRWVSERESIDWKGMHTLTDATSNLRLGIAYLKELKESFNGNTEHALIAYNWGPANLSRALKQRTQIPDAPVKYARGVLREHHKWQTEYTVRSAEYTLPEAAKLIG